MGFFKTYWENNISVNIGVGVYVVYCDVTHTIPPIRALNANPTPQLELFSTAAITPAHFSPCLKKKIIRI